LKGPQPFQSLRVAGIIFNSTYSFSEDDAVLRYDIFTASYIGGGMVLDKLVFGSDNIATHSFTEATEERHVERVAPGAGVLGAWDDTATITATGLVADFSVDTTGRGRIIVGCLCEAALATTLKFRLQFKNSAGTVVGFLRKYVCADRGG
jgi:hypothetical protein